jgi:FMN-dependent dehydrogenase
MHTQDTPSKSRRLVLAELAGAAALLGLPRRGRSAWLARHGAQGATVCRVGRVTSYGAHAGQHVGGLPEQNARFDFGKISRQRDCDGRRCDARDGGRRRWNHRVKSRWTQRKETLRSTIECLPEIVAAVGPRIPVFIDGGIRRGTDVFKALALGATAVGIGRPQVWGLAAFGQSGTEAVTDILTRELRIIMRQAGTPNLKAINLDHLVRPKS